MSEEKDAKEIEKMVEDEAKSGDVEGNEEEKTLVEDGALDKRKSKGGALVSQWPAF